MGEAATGVGATRATNTPFDEVRRTINPDQAVAVFEAFRRVIDQHMTLAETAEAANAAEAGKPLKVTIGAKALDGAVDEQALANLRAAQTALGPQWRALAEPPSYQIGEAHLRAVITKAAAKLPPEVGRQLLQLVTPQALKAMAVILGIWGVGHLFGVSEGVDIGLGIVGLAALGGVGLEAGKEFMQFASELATAQTAVGEDRAADHLARFISIVGVQGAVALLLKDFPKALSARLRGAAGAMSGWAEDVGLVREAGTRPWGPETGAVRIRSPNVADPPGEPRPSPKLSDGEKPSGGKGDAKEPGGDEQKSLPANAGGAGEKPPEPPSAPPAPDEGPDDLGEFLGLPSDVLAEKLDFLPEWTRDQIEQGAKRAIQLGKQLKEIPDDPRAQQAVKLLGKASMEFIIAFRLQGSGAAKVEQMVRDCLTRGESALDEAEQLIHEAREPAASNKFDLLDQAIHNLEEAGLTDAVKILKESPDILRYDQGRRLQVAGIVAKLVVEDRTGSHILLLLEQPQAVIDAVEKARPRTWADVLRIIIDHMNPPPAKAGEPPTK